MKTRLPKLLKRSLLSVFVLATIAVSPQLQATSQVARSQSAKPSIQLAQTQPTRQAVIAVESVGMTVSDMDRAVDFYSRVLSFKKISDVEVLGTPYEKLQGVFGVRLRIVKLLSLIHI